MAMPIDRDALHRYLYRRTDRLGRIKLNVQELAEAVDVSYWALTRIIREMADQGRLQQIAGKKTSVKTYIVKDPEPFAGTGRRAFKRQA